MNDMSWFETYRRLTPAMLPAMDDHRWLPVEQEDAYNELRFVHDGTRVFTARRVKTTEGRIEWHDWAFVVSPSHFMVIT